MALNGIQLCARALIKLGATPLAAFDEATVEATVARNLYPALRDALLAAHPWSFATAQAHLARLVAPPVAEFEVAHQLPADFLRALSAGADGAASCLSYRIVENRLHSDALEVTLTYIFRPPEGSFPPFFDWLLIARLAAEFCLPLTESTSRAEALAQLAEAEFRRAKLIDSQQGTAPALQDFTLIEARG